jgi:arginine decarboxylase-like protein
LILEITAIHITSSLKNYYISVREDNKLIYDSIRDDNKAYKDLEETKYGISQWIKKYFKIEFDGEIIIED